MSDDPDASKPASAAPLDDAVARDRDEPEANLPSWAVGFPNDPALHRLVDAFEQGRYDVVRAEAPRLADTTEDPKVAQAARELLRRLSVDPMAIKLMLGAFALLALLSAWAYTHHHP